MKKMIPIIIIIVLSIAIRMWDNLGAKNISKVWKSTDEQLTLSVSGRQTPIQFFDIDNLFELQITDGGYIYGRTIDLSEGFGDYQAYLEKCSVLWNTNYVSFIEPSGLEIRMPLEMIKNRI